ncbi:MAG TPA: hypothetical protein VD930_02710 [Gemmatimonadales bacterium]|nr:hypothetical protein [Gemmatimonadales bacterium]
MFESLKARLERLLHPHTARDPRARAAALREAVLEAKVAVSTMRSALATTERELAAERRQLTDAERRRRLAEEVPDPETVTVAQRFIARHQERIEILERKLVVQRDELVLAEREAADILNEYRTAHPNAAFDSIDAAWRDLQAAGAERPDLGLDPDPTAPSDHDEKLRQAVDAQLAYLKRKLGKENKPER